MYRPLTNQQNFRVSLLNRNFEGAVILQLVLFTQNSISVEALRVRVNVKLSQILCLIHGRNQQLPLQLATITLSNASLCWLHLVPACSSWF